MSERFELALKGAGQDVERGILLMVAAMLWLPLIDLFAKLLGETMASGQVAWSRFLFQALLLAPLVLINRRRWRRVPLLPHVARGCLIALATLFFFTGLQSLPLADAISIFFVAPLVLTLLSIVFLKEQVGWRRLSAIGVGFLGALIVIRPSYAVFGFAAVLPLLAACCFAFYLLLTRTLAQREDPVAMQFLTGLFGVLAMSGGLLLGGLAEISFLDPIWPNLEQWALMAALGLVATSGHLLVVGAFRRAGASVLAPFQYLEIITATILGLVFFGDFPDITTWLGVAVIVGSGSYVFHRERTLARRAKSG